MGKRSNRDEQEEDAILQWRAEIGFRLREAREAMDLTQQELASKLGLSKQQISHIEVGRSGLNMKDLPVVAQLLGLDIWEFLTGQKAGPKIVPTASNPLIPFPAKKELLFIAGGKLDRAEVKRQIHVPWKASVGAIAYEPEDNAINGLRPSEAYVVVDPELMPSPGNVTLFVLRGNEVLIRRWRLGTNHPPPEPPFSLAADDGSPTRDVGAADAPMFLGTMVLRAILESR